MVEASVEIPDGGNSTLHLSSFSGVVRSVKQGSARALPEHWYIWWENDGAPKPDHGTIVVRRDGFEGATVKGTELTFDEVVEEERTAGEWTVEIRQSWVIVRLAAYV